MLISCVGLCADWKEISWPSSYDPNKPTAGNKRATAASSGDASKKVKREKESGGGSGAGGGGGLSVAEVRVAAEERRLTKLTVANLKDFCKDNSIACKATAKKGDLITLIEGYFGVE